MPSLTDLPVAPATTQSDAALLKRIAGRDSTAFEAFYDRHSDAVHALAARVASPQLADDVVQNVFLSLWRSADGYDPALGDARSWLLTITRNRSIDQIRRRIRTVERETACDALLQMQPQPPNQATDTVALRSIQAAETRDLLHALSPEQHEVVELAFFDELTHPEIASRLRIPLGTVKGRINRGLAAMRGELTPRRSELLGHAA